MFFASFNATHSYHFSIEPNLQYVVFCTMLQRRESTPIMTKLKEMVKTNNNSCLRDLVRKVTTCKYAPVGDENL